MKLWQNILKYWQGGGSARLALLSSVTENFS